MLWKKCKVDLRENTVFVFTDKGPKIKQSNEARKQQAGMCLWRWRQYILSRHQ
jgi:hypothetical protein